MDHKDLEEFCRNAEERTAGYLRRWLANPDFRKCLKRTREEVMAKTSKARDYLAKN